MKRLIGRCGLCLLIILLIPLQTGFVVYSAANPVSISLKETEQGCDVKIELEEDALLRAFQIRLYFDGDKLTLQEGQAFDESFLNGYNANGAALMTSRPVDKGRNSSLILLGVQTDEACALVKKGTQLAGASFHLDLLDADVAERAEAFHTLYLQVEVLEGTDGNLATDEEEWRVYPTQEKEEQDSGEQNKKEQNVGEQNSGEQNRTEQKNENDNAAQNPAGNNLDSGAETIEDESMRAQPVGSDVGADETSDGEAATGEDKSPDGETSTGEQTKGACAEDKNQEMREEQEKKTDVKGGRMHLFIFAGLAVFIFLVAAAIGWHVGHSKKSI